MTYLIIDKTTSFLRKKKNQKVYASFLKKGTSIDFYQNCNNTMTDSDEDCLRHVIKKKIQDTCKVSLPISAD